MIKEILQVYRTHELMVDAEAKIREMFQLAEKTFTASSLALLEQKDVTFDLYARDREINMLVVDIRKKIAEHLSVSACHSVGGALVFLKVINDIERVGDYSKNLLDLAKLLPAPLTETHYYKTFAGLLPQVKGFFAKAQQALFEGSEQDANQVMDGHFQINQACEEVLEELMHSEQLRAPEAIALALTARYFKRVSSHLKNVASTAVNPFSHIGYMQTPDIKSKDSE